MTAVVPPGWVGSAEAARLMGCNQTTACVMAARGEVRAVKLVAAGRPPEWRVCPDACRAVAASGRFAAKPPAPPPPPSTVAVAGVEFPAWVGPHLDRVRAKHQARRAVPAGDLTGGERGDDV